MSANASSRCRSMPGLSVDHTVSEVDELWQHLVDRLSEGDNIWQQLIEGPCYTSPPRLVNVGPREVPVERQNSEGCKKFCNAFLVHRLTERNEIWHGWGFDQYIDTYSYSPNFVNFRPGSHDTMRRHASILHWYACFLWPPYVIGGPLYFCPVVSFLLSSSSIFFFPRLISAAVDRMSAILLHMAWP